MVSTPVHPASLGARLRRLREARGLSQRELARRAGVPNSSVSMIEQDRVSPSIDTLERLLGALPITLSQFFSDQQSGGAIRFFHLPLATEASTSPLEQTLLELPGGAMRLAQHRFAPGTDSGLLPVARAAQLTALVVTGCLELSFEGVLSTLTTGQGFCITGESCYRLVNSSGEPALLFVIHSAGPDTDAL